MKKKINKYLLVTAALTLTATLLISVVIFHHMYQEQVINDMKIYANLLRGLVSSGEEMKRSYTDYNKELRITVISQDGEVIYDDEVENQDLENHGNRPEIEQAETYGSGYAIRHSDTVNQDMYYYAVQLDNGQILRVSQPANSIWKVFYTTLQGILLIAVVIFLGCMVLSRYITASLVRPIENLASHMDQIERTETYEELVPFITTIRQQHLDILKNAQMRQEFTANVSHELKTPLTSISGYAELIETGLAGEGETRRFAREISRNAKRLLTLINDIIKLSELDSDQVEMTYTEVDLYEISRSCVEMLQLNAKNHGIHISCSGSRSVIQANRQMLEELVYNLCDNAIRYNRLGGKVEVSVRPRQGVTYLTVKDTGIGIPKESQERVFERFYRVDKSRSKQTGGTGLGLAIVKHIVARHHAQIKLESEEGQGTEITVMFENQIQNA